MDQKIDNVEKQDINTQNTKKLKPRIDEKNNNKELINLENTK